MYHQIDKRWFKICGWIHSVFHLWMSPGELLSHPNAILHSFANYAKILRAAEKNRGCGAARFYGGSGLSIIFHILVHTFLLYVLHTHWFNKIYRFWIFHISYKYIWSYKIIIIFFWQMLTWLAYILNYTNSVKLDIKFKVSLDSYSLWKSQI